MGRLRMSLLLLIVIFLALSKPVAANAAADEDPASTAAIRAVTSDDPVAVQLAAVPADFAYRPTGARYALDPSGGCSSPIALPEVFDEPCMAHDLGYDLLRYAAAKGHPLGAWARERLDSTFERRLTEACEPSNGLRYLMCEAAAKVANVAVRVNSWRQHSGVPVPESGGQIAASFVTAAVRR